MPVGVFREGAEQERCSATMPVRADANALRGVSDEVMAIAVCKRKITGTLFISSHNYRSDFSFSPGCRPAVCGASKMERQA